MPKKILPPSYWSSDQFLATVARESPYFAKVFIDRVGKLAYVNVGAEKILGYSNDELVGTDLCVFFTEEDKELGVATKELKKALHDGYAEDDRWHIRKDGTRFWATGIVTSIFDGEGDFVGYCKEFRDTSLRKSTEDDIRSENARLRDFTAVVAHDLQQPLRTITTYLQMLVRDHRGTINPASENIIQTVTGATADMSRLIQDLLLYSRMGHETHELDQVVDLNAAFDISVAHLRAIIEESGARVTRALLPRVLALPTKMEQLFQNLLANAIKHRSAETPHIYVEVLQQSGQWLFSVKDNGAGIDSVDHKRIFEAFERSGDISKSPGTGLGLAICRKIVEQQGGEIWVQSEKGKGATFFFTLPDNKVLS